MLVSVLESIKKTQEESVEEIGARRDAEQKRFEELTVELRQEVDELKKKSVELKQLSHIEDHITFVQVGGGIILSCLLCE